MLCKLECLSISNSSAVLFGTFNLFQIVELNYREKRRGFRPELRILVHVQMWQPSVQSEKAH